MEQEVFVSGYCRMLDQNRTVEAVIADGTPPEVDCNFGGCIFEGSCPIAEKLRKLT